ncbi:MAG: SIS domain-containing protein [Azospirillum sp.]|nr:SIS domain-containing protein [Azospirillum sp.]
MTQDVDAMVAEFGGYSARLSDTLAGADLSGIALLGRAMRECWRLGRSLYLCGNGGSAGNAVHLANDLVYGIAEGNGPGLRAHALPANIAVVTCLANDIEYSEIFAAQLTVFARPGDLLLALSGSGNSPNILRAIETAKDLGMETFAVLGYSGGKAKAMADVAIHFPVDDMQISEDLQLVVGHMIMQWLYRNPLN